MLSADRTTTGRAAARERPAPAAGRALHLVRGRHRLGRRARRRARPSAGTPGILIGQTAHAAWGFTNVEADTQDLLEVTLDGSEERRTEQIAVRGRRAPIEHEVVTTPHGPVVTPLAAGETRTLALQWTALRPAGNVRRVPVDRRRPGRPTSSLTALAGVGGPTLNCVYATLAGEIGYQMCGGPVPIRARPATAGSRPPSPGSAPCRTRSCRRGAIRRTATIVTANNRIVPDDYPHLIATEWLNPYRAQRIADLLAQRTSGTAPTTWRASRPTSARCR